MTNLQEKQIRAYRESGYSLSQISKELEIPLNTVKSFTRRKGIEVQQEATVVLCRQCSQPIIQKQKRKRRIFCCNHCKQTWWNRRRSHHEQAN